MTEPVTAITDYILAVEVIILGILLRSTNANRENSVHLWGLSFFAIGVAAIAGGTFHGFRQQMEPLVSSLFWRISNYSIATAVLFFVLAGIFVLSPQRFRRPFLILAMFQFITYLYLSTKKLDPAYLLYSNLPLLLALLILGIRRSTNTGKPRSYWMITGILVSAVGVALLKSGLQLHRHFNHNDLYHVIQMGAMFLLYKGGLQLQDQ